MGATSVTGISGQGTAAKPGKGNKGSEHMSLAVHRLIGPRVVMAGIIQLTAPEEEGDPTATVYFPTLPGVVSQYSIQLTPDASTDHWFDNFTTSQFDVFGDAEATIHWAVIKNGLWGSPTTGLADS